MEVTILNLQSKRNKRKRSICSAHAPPTIEIVARVAKSAYADWEIDRIHPNRHIPYHTKILVRAGGLGTTSSSFSCAMKIVRYVDRSHIHPSQQ